MPLMTSVEAISGCRERGRLPEFLVAACDRVIEGQGSFGVYAKNEDDEYQLRYFSGKTIPQQAAALWSEMISQTNEAGEVPPPRVEDGLHYGIISLQASELGQDPLQLGYQIPASLIDDRLAVLESLARIYGQQVKLIDYSELDTLTRLLNRKTFEEAFDRLLAPLEDEDVETLCGIVDRRHSSPSEDPAWLCVIDIDHFKRINDSFGHLFGDEVLLRLGNLLRQTFRQSDRLFRFGGEEFVIILNAADQANASRVLNRLRELVVEHKFPQVGQVTCSIGFTQVTDTDIPTDAIGRADEALYYAKKNGRNQVWCFEQLLEQGLVEKPDQPSAEPDFDIDALFD